jgi:hypothetical protein
MKDYNQAMRIEMSTIAIGRLIENPLLSVIFLIFGVIAILIAIFGKEFKVADSEGFEFKSKRPMPTWLGKLIAGIVGCAFVLYALTSLWSQSFR